MTRRSGRQALSLAAVIVCVGCGGGSQVTGPTPISPPAATLPAPLPTPGNLPPSGVAGTYRYVGPLDHPVNSYTETSSLVLDRAGVFTLRFDTCCGGGYVGRYEVVDGRLRFTFTGDNRWEAIGTFNDELLELRYNDIMAMSDFDNAVYRQAP